MLKQAEPLLVQPKPIPARGNVAEELEWIAKVMDNAFRVPGSRIRFGFDALLGLIPGFGDFITSLVSLYLMSAARRQGVSRVTLVRMASNVAIDFVLGAFPIVGDVFDVFWKANERNLSLLRKHATATSRAESRRLTAGDWAFVGLLFGGLFALLVGTAVIAYYLAATVFQLLFTATQ